jgi:hypothetical protein
VKQSDLGEYEENARETQNIQYTRQSINSLSNQAIWMANTNFHLKRAATKTQGFLMTKDNTPPEAKANHKLPPQTKAIKSDIKLNKRRRLPLK